jgi:hypothetical protein
MRLDNNNTREYLNAFAKYVIQQSRSNLSKGGKNYEKKLYNSLDKQIEVGANSFRLAFLMEDYGKFVDKGVKGANPSNVSPNAKIRGQQAPNSPYRFGSGNFKGQWGDFKNKLEKWVKAKGLRFRDSKGKYRNGNAKSMAQVVASNIYARGIKPSLFFTKPFEKAFERLPDELIEAYGLDVEQFLEYTINKK